MRLELLPDNVPLLVALERFRRALPAELLPDTVPLFFGLRVI